MVLKKLQTRSSKQPSSLPQNSAIYNWPNEKALALDHSDECCAMEAAHAVNGRVSFKSPLMLV